MGFVTLMAKVVATAGNMQILSIEHRAEGRRWQTTMTMVDFALIIISCI